MRYSLAAASLILTLFAGAAEAQECARVGAQSCINGVVNECAAAGAVNDWGAKAPYERCEVESINGSWNGSGHQMPVGAPGLAHYAIDMTISGNGGTIDYPDRHCGGMIARIGDGGTSGTFREHLTHGVDKCADGETITVHVHNGQLDWARGGDGAAVLTRSP